MVHSVEHRGSTLFRESRSDLASESKFTFVVVADEQRVEHIAVRPIAAHHEFLAIPRSPLQPVAGPFPRLIPRLPTLRHDAFKPKRANLSFDVRRTTRQRPGPEEGVSSHER